MLARRSSIVQNGVYPLNSHQCAPTSMMLMMNTTNQPGSNLIGNGYGNQSSNSMMFTQNNGANFDLNGVDVDQQQQQQPSQSQSQQIGPGTISSIGATQQVPTFNALSGLGMLPDGPGGFGMIGELEECIRTRTIWWESPTIRKFLRFCALLSLVSVSMNTPYTFSQMPALLYITFVIDNLVTLAFTIEFISKLRIRGARTYFHDRWSQFDIAMLLCLIISLTLHLFEMTGHVQEFSPLSMIRAPRPLIMVRVVRVFLSFSMPRARITQIFLRSSQQIYNVTLFFIFFMSLFGLLGVQFFSSLNHHCVLIDNFTETNQPSIHHLAIPDTYCSPEESHGHQCPQGMICVEINNSSGYAGFDNLAHALFTVYQSASQEGWSHVMYQAMDSLDFFRSAIYFVMLIFFLAWLVKNVFIAVITETFNEIRVQFQQMWGERAQITTQTVQLVLVGDERWKLVQLTDSNTQTRAPHIIRKVLSTASFQIFVMFMIVVNAIINASIRFDHSGKSRDDYYRTIYPTEVFFTIFFLIEVILKIWCYGFRSYVRRSLHKLEFLLAIGSTIHVFPTFYMTSPLVYFQVLRIIRLIKASPVLEDFVYKIFGPGKKLGSLIIFTMCLLIVTSSISMQLFCCFPGYNKFQSFPEAFMSMFQILTQEGWTEVMNETILRSGSRIGPLVAIYFILYHLFVSLIVLSLFVAVILDNLELDEDIKKVKQLKAREQSAGYNEELPLRLRLFESFPDSPQMTRLHKQANEFNVPKVRDSFMRAFIESTNTSTTIVASSAAISSSAQAAAISTMTPTALGNVLQNQLMTQMSTTIDTSNNNICSSANATNRSVIGVGNLTASNKPMLPSLCSSGTNSIGGLFVSTRKPSSIKLLSSISKGRHSSPLLRRVQVACIVSDSNNQRMLLNDASMQGMPGVGAGGPGAGGPSSASGTTQGGFNRGLAGGVGSRGMRRSVRGNLKDEIGTEESHSGTGNGPLVRGQDFDFKMLQRKQKQAEMRRTQRESDLRENHPFFDTPLLIVGRESRFRMICQNIISAKYDPNVRDPVTGKERKVRYKGAHGLLGLVPYCDWFMIIITTVSCASMMCETGENRITNTPILVVAEYTFVFTMAIELTLKTLAQGLLFTPNAYLANVAGVMDFVIFGISVLFLCIFPKHVPPQSWQQTLYVMRCIRPLRIFSLVPHMRKVVYELCRGVKEIALVSVLLIVLLFVFASVGVHMFGGLLARCNDPCIKTREECVGVFMRQVHVTRMKLTNQNEKMPSVLVPRVWANPRRFNFDSLGNGILALFEVLSFKGWLDIRDVILARLTPVHAIYIHVFVFLGCMIGLTLFVGVVIANYGENKGTALLTVDQRRWCDLKKRLKIAQPLHLPPRPDHHRARAIIYDITQHIIFKRTIAILVLINSALLCVSWDINMEHTKLLANVSASLTCVFVFEVLMKMIAFTPRGYWQSRRNRYDLFVTVLGVLWLILHFTFASKASNAFGFIVVILRFFTITGKHATLKMLMLTVAVSVYKSFFIIMGLFLLILCYALIGVILFGSVKFGENISRHANFKTAITGVITLFRIVTGEDWNKIMHDAMLSPPFCTPSRDNFWTTDCGNYYASLAFFCSFYVCITYIVLNLLVAIIMENFSLFYSNEEDALLSYADIRNFQNTWNLVDIQQRGMIPVSRVKFVLRLLKGRLEVDPNKDRLLFKHMCHEMERLHNSEDVTFHDVLNMLSYRSVDIRKSLQLEELLAREELEFLIEEEVAKQTIRAWLDKCLRRIKKERQQQSLINSLRATNDLVGGQPTSFVTNLIGPQNSPNKTNATNFDDESNEKNPNTNTINTITTINSDGDRDEAGKEDDRNDDDSNVCRKDRDNQMKKNVNNNEIKTSMIDEQHQSNLFGKKASQSNSFGNAMMIEKINADNNNIGSTDTTTKVLLESDELLNSMSGAFGLLGQSKRGHYKNDPSHHQGGGTGGGGGGVGSGSSVPHQHRRVEFRHVEERSKKVNEQLNSLQQASNSQSMGQNSQQSMKMSNYDNPNFNSRKSNTMIRSYGNESFVERENENQSTTTTTTTAIATTTKVPRFLHYLEENSFDQRPSSSSMNKFKSNQAISKATISSTMTTVSAEVQKMPPPTTVRKYQMMNSYPPTSLIPSFPENIQQQQQLQQNNRERNLRYSQLKEGIGKPPIGRLSTTFSTITSITTNTITMATSNAGQSKELRGEINENELISTVDSKDSGGEKSKLIEMVTDLDSVDLDQNSKRTNITAERTTAIATPPTTTFAFPNRSGSGVFSSSNINCSCFNLVGRGSLPNDRIFTRHSLTYNLPNQFQHHLHHHHHHHHHHHQHHQQQQHQLNHNPQLPPLITDLANGQTNPSLLASSASGNKKISQVRAQILVNEVHDWWLFHLN